MTAYLLYGVATLAVILLAVWSPEAETFASIVRGYFLVLIGLLLLVFGLAWLITRLGYPELTVGQGLLFAVIGAFTGLAALLRYGPYWEVASVWPLFQSMSERVRQGVLTVAGAGLLGLGLHGMTEARRAYQDCRHWYQVAVDTHERLIVLRRVPNAGLRPYRDAAPMTCESLLRGR